MIMGRAFLAHSNIANFWFLKIHLGILFKRLSGDIHSADPGNDWTK
jgi:hypothetical protein